MDENDYIGWLEEDDLISRPGRAVRLKETAEALEHVDHLFIANGLHVMHAFEDARRAYINGLWVACVITSQVAIEGMLFGRLGLHGNIGRRSFAQVLDLALEDGLISEDEHTLFNRIRVTRNPYVHAGDGAITAGTFMQRVRDEAANPFDIMEGDAREAVMALLHLMGRYPFPL